MKPHVTMRDALADPEFFGTILEGESWHVWRVLLIAIMGEELTDDEREVFSRLTNREHEPLQPVEEFWGVVGRRGGKTRAMSVLSAYLAALCDWSDALVPGERGRLIYSAFNQKQASVALGYATALFTTLPLFEQLVEDVSRETISLSNGIDLEVRASTWRGLRSITAIGAIFDELAFFHSDEFAANADREILNALRPALATTGGPLIAITSPFGRQGEVFKAVEKYHVPDADPRIVVARGSSRDFNPSLPQGVVDRALERDPVAARSEYLGEFRDTEAAFIDLPTVRDCIAAGVLARPPRRNAVTSEFNEYYAFVDPSGGRTDAMTLAIAHDETRRTKDGKLSERVERDVVVLDAVFAAPAPFKPRRVVWQFAEALKTYGITSVTGDNFAAEWAADEFRRAGIRYHRSRLNRSEIYLNFLPMLTDRSIELLDHGGLVSELTGLQRKVTGAGREAVDHRQGGHDDVANAVAGVATLVALKRRRGRTTAIARRV
jgi:hypothetical protein